jgi:hypothetical protein
MAKSKDLIEHMKDLERKHKDRVDFGKIALIRAMPFDTIGDLVLVPKDSLLTWEEFTFIDMRTGGYKRDQRIMAKLQSLTRRGD